MSFAELKPVQLCNINLTSVRFLSRKFTFAILLLLKCSFRNSKRVHGYLKQLGLCNPSECSIEFLRIFSSLAGFFYEVPNTARLVQESFLEQKYFLEIFPVLDPRLKWHFHQQISSWPKQSTINPIKIR